MFISSDEIVTATHLQIRYHTADEHVYRLRRMCFMTVLALETNTFHTGDDEHFSAGV